MWRLADHQLDEFVADGHCEFIEAYTQPFAMLVVADLLGVPEEDHQRFREGFGLGKSPGAVGKGEEGSVGQNPLAWLDEWFADYIEDRRATPRKDVLTDLALATYPDGTTPDVTSVVRTATFLFAAGQETTARLLAAALKHLAEHPELQDQLRADRDLIPDFLEEALRIESPVKTDFRLTKRSTTVGGVDIKAGTPVMLLNGAANRDPRRFECPAEFRVDRANAQSHLAFGRGVHSCPGGPLARAEGRISLERILDRTRNIRLSEEHHGPPDDRHFTYEPTWILRGLTNLHLEFDPVEAPVDDPRRGGHRGRRRASGSASPSSSRPTATRVALLDRNGPGWRQPPPSSGRRHEGDRASRSTSPTAAPSTPPSPRRGPSSARSGSSSPAPGSSRSRRSLDITPELWDRIIAVNLTGTFACIQAAVPDMVAAGWGRIVTISSQSAQSGAPNMTHYAASKGGVIALTKALAVELARKGITANTISPSVVDTPMARAATEAGDFPGIDVIAPHDPARSGRHPGRHRGGVLATCAPRTATSPARSSP